jgi:hypothetical protein
MEAGLFSPMTAHMVLILVGVISLVALVGISYNYSLMLNARSKIAKIEDMEQELKTLQRELKELKAQMVKYQFKEAAPIDKGVPKSAVNTAAAAAAESPLKQEVWQAFVDDYNNLANSMEVPKAAKACEDFVRNNRLHLLICVETSDTETGGGSPLYAPVDEVELSNFWAWQVPGKEETFVVVPNPLVEYNAELHNRKGMKETFASNYEKGSFKQIQVKLPARFTQRLGAWKIVQPGVIKVQ